MGPRRSVLVLAFLVFAFLVPALRARAEDHKWAAFAAVSGTKTGTQSLGGGSLWNGGLAAGPQADDERSGPGWHVAAEVTLHLPWVGDKIAFVGDLSTHLIGEEKKSDATQIVIMVGPRLNFRLPRQFHVFGHFMGLGAIHRSDNRLNLNPSTMAWALGLGLDFVPLNKDAQEHGHDGFRVQVDWIFAIGSQLDGARRYSFGYVHRFD